MFNSKSKSDLGHNDFPISLNYFTGLPDPTHIASAQLAIIFKSLMKKDATTKEKSLTDLTTSFNNSDLIPYLKEEITIHSWLQLFPKLAFDNSRLVRLLSIRTQANFLRLIGGKAFSKYLKSSLPVWLACIYDNDKQVAKEAYGSLLESFQNDPEKLDSKIWHIFSLEILHFIVVSLTLESKKSLSDDRNTSDSDSTAKHQRLINGSLNLLNKLIILINQTDIEIDTQELDALLDNDLVWENFAVSMNPKTFNSAMANTYLVLLKSIFQEDKLQKGSQNRLCKELGSSRSLYRHTSKRFLKMIKVKGSNIVYGTVILQFWGTLINLTRFSNLEAVKKPKENFWDIGNGSARLIEYVKLGDCNSDPIYYILLKNCLSLIIENSQLDFSQLGKEIIDNLVSKIPKLRPASKETSLECLFGFIDQLDQPKMVSEVFPKIVNAKLSDGCVKVIVNSVEKLSDKDLEELGTQMKTMILGYISKGDPEIDSYLKLLTELNIDVTSLVSDIIEDLAVVENNQNVNRSFEVLNKIIKSGVKFNKDELIEFTSSVGMYLEEDTITPIINYLFTVWENKQLGIDIDNDIVGDLLLKFDMLHIDSSDIISKFSNLGIQSEEISSSIDKIVSKPNKSAKEWELVLDSVQDPLIFHNLIISTEKLELVSHFKSEKSTELTESDKDMIVDILIGCWSKNQSFVEFIQRSGGEKLVLNSLWSYLETENVNWTVINEERKRFLWEKFEEKLSKVPVNKDMLSVSNSLKANIHLVEIVSENKEEGDSLSLHVINQLSKCKKNDYYGLLLNQYIEDLIFLTNHDTKIDIEVSKVKIDIDLKSALEILIDGKDVRDTSQGDDTFHQLVDKSNTGVQVYVSRIIRDILEEASENSNLNQFETFDLDFNKLLKAPLKLGIVLSGLQTFIMSSKFDRIRNYVVSEILGVKNPISGLNWLVLTTNFLVDEPDFIPIPPHRLNMVLRQFEKWLDSEYSYENEFIAIRNQITRIVTFYNENEDLIERLVPDNLDLIKLEVETRFELRYTTLRLMTRLENKFDIVEFLFDKSINQSDNSINNSVVNLCQDMLQRNLVNQKIDTTFEALLELCTETKFIQLKQICIGQLVSQVTKYQQEMVLNYQFRENDDITKLPDVVLSPLQDYHYGESNLNYYILWYLVLLHFKDINYSLRNQYLSQIKDLLGTFLEIIFEYEQIDYERFPHEDFDSDEVELDSKSLLIKLYYMSCKYVGSEVQSWFNQLRNVQMKQHIEAFTKTNISSIIVKQMLDQVEESKAKLVTDIMTIKVNRVINEIRSVFEIDDQTMEMVIKIPANFPLENVVVEGPKRVGLKENEWKAWLLASQRVISLTNGSILESIEIFKKNVDLHFSGFEDCAICYSILHQDHSLPSKNCATCSNKFHAACLYKWFKSSGSSTCPLCRSVFNFRKT